MAVHLLWLAIAGAVGTLARFGLSTLVTRLVGSGFPWATFAVNAVGCLLFGLVWSVTESRLPLSAQTRVVVLTGFLGAFTTFSTFAFESTDLFTTGRTAASLANVLGQCLVGIVLVLAGLWLGRLVA